MQDRVSLYPGRVKLVPVAGQENTYDMVRADSPTQEGTPLNKDSLLKDATAALLGGDSSMLPDEALVILKTLVDNAQTSADEKAKIQTGSYVGTGTYGTANPCSLTFDFEPLFGIILGNKSPIADFNQNMNPGFLAVRGTSGFYNLIAQSSGSYYGPLFTWETNKLTGYATRNAIAQANVSNEKYYYFFVGI